MAKQKKNKRDCYFGNLLRKEKLDKSAILNQLSNYASDHSSFSFYAAIDDKKQYKDKKFYLFFGLSNGWEDKEDKEKYKKNISKDELCFVRCLSYQQTESIAMWHMYGLPNNVRITIKGSVLRNGLGLVNKQKDTLKAYLICKGNQIGEKFEINSSEIEKFDLLYYSPNKDENTYLVQKGANAFPEKIKGESIAQLKDEFFLKRYAFASEVETRLQIRLKKKLLEEHLPKRKKLSDICGLAVEPNFKKEDVEQIIIVRRPEFLDVRNIKRKAYLGKTIKYLDSKKYPSTMYDEKIALEKSELDEEEIDMKKIAEDKKQKVTAKAKNKLDELTKFVCDEDKMKEINNFKTRFEICEILLKQLYIQYKKDQGEKNVDAETMTSDMKKAHGVLSHFGYNADKSIILKLFGSEKAKGKRSAKSIRDALTHDFNESVADELHSRKNEIDGYMDYFLSLIRDQNV